MDLVQFTKRSFRNCGAGCASLAEDRLLLRIPTGLISAMGVSQDAIAARVRSAIEGEPDFFLGNVGEPFDHRGRFRLVVVPGKRRNCLAARA
jgi:hypothetical protein